MFSINAVGMGATMFGAGAGRGGTNSLAGLIGSLLGGGPGGYGEGETMGGILDTPQELMADLAGGNQPASSLIPNNVVNLITSGLLSTGSGGGLLSGM